MYTVSLPHLETASSTDIVPFDSASFISFSVLVSRGFVFLVVFSVGFTTFVYSFVVEFLSDEFLLFGAVFCELFFVLSVGVFGFWDFVSFKIFC